MNNVTFLNAVQMMDPSAHPEASGTSQPREAVQLAPRSGPAGAVDDSIIRHPGALQPTALTQRPSYPIQSTDSSQPTTSSQPAIHLVPQSEAALPGYTVVQLNLTDVHGRVLEGSDQLLEQLRPHQRSDTNSRDVPTNTFHVPTHMPEPTVGERRDGEELGRPAVGSDIQRDDESTSKAPTYRIPTKDGLHDLIYERDRSIQFSVGMDESAPSDRENPLRTDHDPELRAAEAAALIERQYAVPAQNPIAPASTSEERDIRASANNGQGAHLDQERGFRQVPAEPESTSQSLECEDCGKAFQLERHLAHHRKTHELKEKPYSCDDCGQAYVSSASLRQHIKVCSVSREKLLKQKRKPIVCQVCDQKFVSKASLERHTSVHQGESGGGEGGEVTMRDLWFGRFLLLCSVAFSFPCLCARLIW